MSTFIKKAITLRASSIGDALMAKYLLENVHAQFPNARLGIVVASRGSMLRDLFLGYSWLEIIETNRRDLFGLWRLWRRFHASDMVVTQYAGKHGGQFGLASKLAARVLARPGSLIGFRDVSLWNAFLYTHLLPVRSDQAVAEHERAALRVAGLAVPIPYPRLQITPDPQVLNTHQLVQGEYIVVHFFAGNPGRSIGLAHAQNILKQLQNTFPSVRLVISGGPSDRAQAEKIAEGFVGAVVLAGSASLQEMMQLVWHSKSVVSVDTGIAHITAQLQKPLVVMRTCLGPNWWFAGQYGPQSPIQQLSAEHLCTPHVSKDYPDCLSGIEASSVVDACVALSARTE